MNKPNVLVIMSDQFKATASHLWGSTFCKTPSLERMADEGVRFENAFTPHPLCVPARVSLWRSQFPHAHGSRRNELLMWTEGTHAFQIWKEEGFDVGLIGKNHCFDRPEDLDLFDVWCEISHGGFNRRSGFPNKGMEWVRPVEAIEEAHAMRRNMPDRGAHTSYAVTDFPLEDYGTGVVTSQTVRFLEEHREDPFALWVSYPDPHSPYEAPKKYADMFAPDVIDLPPWGEDDLETLPERNRVLYHMLSREDEPMENVYGYLACYYGMVRFLDDGVGRILDALERLDLRENTIVVFCADHGDFAGEHCMGQKGGVFYDCLTHIPMIVSYPGHIPEGEAEEGMVNLIDVVPTLFNLQGISTPRCMQGEPLPTVTDTVPQNTAFSEYGAGGPPFTMEDLRELPQPYGRYALMQSLRWREAEGRRKMVRTRDWKYVHDPMDDKDELYDLVNDPWELTNVIDDPTHDLVVRDLQARLADWSIMTEDGHCVPLPEDKYYDLPWER